MVTADEYLEPFNKASGGGEGNALQYYHHFVNGGGGFQHAPSLCVNVEHLWEQKPMQTVQTKMERFLF